MKPYMPPTPENYQRVLKDIHARAIQMWAGCIWVPIYEVMTRKQLTMVTLEENLEMAADIGIDATTSLDEAFAAAIERHGPDAKVIVLPFARYQLPKNAIRMHADAKSSCSRRCGSNGHRQGIDHDRGAPSPLPERRGGRLMARLNWPCAHCGGAFHEPLTMAAQRHRNSPRAALEAFRALKASGPSDDQIERPPRSIAEEGVALMEGWPLQKTSDKGHRVKAAQRLLRAQWRQAECRCGLRPRDERPSRRSRRPTRWVADGIIGNQTWPVLIVKVASGDQGEAVTAAQELLSPESLGLTADGIFGPETREGGEGAARGTRAQGRRSRRTGHVARTHLGGRGALTRV